PTGRYLDERVNFSRIDLKFRENGSVKDKSEIGRPLFQDRTQDDLVFSSVENPSNLVSVSRQHDIAKSSDSKIFKPFKHHPYKILFTHGLLDDDFDRRIDIYDTLLIECNQNSNFCS
ncbi:hypothetical protein ABEB36_000338, partial [Hypothenemus hampei]